jgi:hypothetical protein
MLDSFAALSPSEALPFLPYLYDDDKVNSSGTFEVKFIYQYKIYVYSLRVKIRTVQNEKLCVMENDKELVLYERNTDNIKSWYCEESIKDGMDNINKSTRKNASVISTAAQFNHPFLGALRNYLSDSIQGIHKTDDKWGLKTTLNLMENKSNKNSILEFVKHADIGQISDILIKESEIKDADEFGIGNKVNRELLGKGKSDLPEIKFLHPRNNVTMPFEYESRGTQRLFEMSGPLLNLIKEEQFLAIDEIESSLHNELLEYFIATFLDNSNKSQILFTTHNQDLLDSDLLRNDEVWFAQKSREGASEFYSLAEFKNVPDDISRRQFYKVGKFGALPLIRSFRKDEV